MKKLKSIIKAKYLILLLLIGVTFEVIIIFAGSSTFVLFFNKSSSLDAYAAKIVEFCRDEEYRPSCYDKEIPKLMDKITMEEAFAVTSLVQDRDKEYTYCHVLGHNLSAREVGKDPSKWRDVLTRCPPGECSNGCLHGGLQEKFRKEYLSEREVDEIKPQLIGLCEPREGWNPTGLEKGSCYHALGHLTMYLTQADAKKATDLCDELVTGESESYTQICYDGAFMQIFQPLEPEDFALIKGKEITAETSADFCAGFDELQKSSCHTESWPLFYEEIINPKTIVDFCGRGDSEMIERCFNVMFFVMATQLQLNKDRILAYCSEIEETWMPTCFANAAARFIEVDYQNIDIAIDFCKEASVFDKGGACFEELIKYSDYNFHPGSPENIKLCNDLPDEWRSRCLNKTNN